MVCLRLGLERNGTKISAIALVAVTGENGLWVRFHGLNPQRPTMTIATIPNRVKILKQKFTQSLGLPFRDLLPESTIFEALEAERIK
jgi:hypothetical protein